MLRLNVFAASNCRLHFRLDFGFRLFHEGVLDGCSEFITDDSEHFPAVSILFQTLSLYRGLRQVDDNLRMALSLYHKRHMLDDLTNFRLHDWRWRSTLSSLLLLAVARLFIRLDRLLTIRDEAILTLFLSCRVIFSPFLQLLVELLLILLS